MPVTRELVGDSGLSDADYDVLSSAPASGPEQRLRLGTLAGPIRWSHSRLSHHVGRMEQRGLVVREDDRVRPGVGRWSC